MIEPLCAWALQIQEMHESSSADDITQSLSELSLSIDAHGLSDSADVMSAYNMAKNMASSQQLQSDNVFTSSSVISSANVPDSHSLMGDSATTAMGQGRVAPALVSKPPSRRSRRVISKTQEF